MSGDLGSYIARDVEHWCAVGSVLLLLSASLTPNCANMHIVYRRVPRATRQSVEDAPGDKLLHAADLVPRKVAEKWLAYLREELPTVAFKCSTQQQASHLSHKRLPVGAAPEGALQTSECLGAEALLQLLKNYSRNADVKTAITVGEALGHLCSVCWGCMAGHSISD